MGCQIQCNTNSCNFPKYLENEIVTIPKTTHENIPYNTIISQAKTGVKEIPLNEYLLMFKK
jgi:hypothetical protein